MTTERILIEKKDGVTICGLDINIKSDEKGRDLKRSWERLLLEWIFCIEKYCLLYKGTKNDPPVYWYGEKANTSVLAGAAWRAGYIALQEYESEKEEKTGQPHTDLWIQFEKEESVIEAKFCPSDTEEEGIVEEIQKWLHNACLDAKENITVSERVGILFYCQKFKKNAGDEEINMVIEEARKTKCDAIAWCFPSKTRYYLDEDNNQIVPGVILLARVA